MCVEYAIQTSGLSKYYGTQAAVDTLNLNVPRRSIYGFVGRNGAGKSTTMKMLSGLVAPTEGRIKLFGKQAEQYHDPIGVIIEQPGLLTHLNAQANLTVKALARGIPNARNHCTELLELVGLADVGRKKVRGFSLGMKHRLGLALAFVGTPDLLLLDEPLNGLDPEGTRAMRSLLAHLRDERGVTILISSHVLDQLNRVADRFGVIAQGHMVAEFTDEQMQEACGEFIRLNTSNNPRALALLQEAFPHVELHIERDGTLDLGGIADTQTISCILQKAELNILELTPVRRDIEDFFLDIMEKGTCHA